MDKFWSVGAMPIGLLVCFFPVLIAWVLKEMKGDSDGDKNRR
jgi:hypothetical protein